MRKMIITTTAIVKVISRIMYVGTFVVMVQSGFFSRELLFMVFLTGLLQTLSSYLNKKFPSETTVLETHNDKYKKIAWIIIGLFVAIIILGGLLSYLFNK